MSIPKVAGSSVDWGGAAPRTRNTLVKLVKGTSHAEEMNGTIIGNYQDEIPVIRGEAQAVSETIRQPEPVVEDLPAYRKEAADLPQTAASEPEPQPEIDLRPPAARQSLPEQQPAAEPSPLLQQPKVVVKRVVMQSPTMGKHTVVVADLVVSDTLVCLWYENDGSMTIVEPPECGADSPLTIVINPRSPDEQRFKVIYGDWTAEHGDRLMVVFIRIDG